MNISDRSSGSWIGYFKRNAKHLLAIPWHHPYRLTPREREAVMDSLRMFELGEKSLGRTFLRLARAYSSRHDKDYLTAVKLFIREEQRHSRTLRRFLIRSGETLYATHWVDSAFRRLRRSLDIEIEIMVLVTAEIIAIVYYKAVRACTRSRILCRICDQILRDETQHLNFQASSLSKFRMVNHPMRIAITTRIHPILLLETCFIVWIFHWKVFAASGYSLPRFLREVFLVFRKVHRIATGTL